MRNNKVLVINLYFAHYRSALIRYLLDSQLYSYLLCADTRDVTGANIQVWLPDDRTRFKRIPSYKLKYFYLQRGIVRLALNREYGTVIYPGDAQNISTWISALVARLTGKRVLFWTHGWYGDESGLKTFVRKTFYHIAHGLLLYGERARTICIRKGFQPQNLYVIYNSLDTEEQKRVRQTMTAAEVLTARKQLFAQPDHPVVICSGRLIKRRGVDLLLEAMSVLKQQGHNLNAIVVGDGPERATLEQMTSNLGLSVVFTGPCYDESILGRLFSCANVTVSPGVVGLAVMHSLVYGTPVITHDCFEDQGPEVEAIHPGINGDFFHKGDVQDLARVIRAWTQTMFTSDAVRQACYQQIDDFYNPSAQRDAIERAITGVPCE